MSQHRLLTAMAAKLNTGVSASATGGAPLNTPPAAPAAPAAGTEADAVDVVTLADANAAVAHAESVGATNERTRFCAVLNSEAGQGNVPLATFMLENNPTASADAIIAHLNKQPKAATTTPAPAAAAAPAAPGAITTPLAETPLITIAPNTSANNGGEEDPERAAKLWDSAAKASGPGMGAAAGELAPGVPRTGN
jgi:hypothetical protein